MILDNSNGPEVSFCLPDVLHEPNLGGRCPGNDRAGTMLWPVMREESSANLAAVE